MHHASLNDFDYFFNAFVYVLLLSIRFGLALTPILQAAAAPAWVRVPLVVGLSLLCSTETRMTRMDWIDEPYQILHGAVSELIAGFSLGMGVMLALQSVSMAGALLDVQIGFGMARVFDISGKKPSSFLNAVFNLVGTLVFFLLDMHLMVLRALARSVNLFPVGQGWLPQAFLEDLFHLIGVLFALGLALAAPLVLVIFVFDLFLAVLGRTLPQMNMLVFGVPLKIILGLIFLSIWSGAMGGAVERIYSELLRHWFNLFVEGKTSVTWGRAGQWLASVNVGMPGDG